MPSTETLVNDIYGLFTKKDGHNASPENLEKLGRDIVELAARRLAETPRPSELRFSSIGRPDRQLWYDHNSEEEAQELAPYTKIKFMYGDILECLLLFFAREAGHDVTDEQLELELDDVKGHIDARINGQIADVKSASSYSFKKFQEGTLKDNDPFGYIGQLSSYAKAGNSDKPFFLAIDKQNGHITTLQLDKEVVDNYDPQSRIAHVKEVIQSPEPPARCYPDKEEGKQGNRVLGLNCSYCRHKDTCWSDANEGQGLRTFFYSTGPKFFTKVESEPRVPEKGEFPQDGF